MSYTISYQLLAVKFPKQQLEAIFPNAYFFDDRYLLLELSGSNNCTTANPYTGREVGVRYWHFMAFGHKTRILEDVCRFASYCEGGNLKLYGRSTRPEAYIRHARNVVSKSISADECRQFGFSLAVNLNINQFKEDDQDRYRQLLQQHIKADESEQWVLYPLNHIEHAAFLFAFCDYSKIWNSSEVLGPCFSQENTELFSSLSKS